MLLYFGCSASTGSERFFQYGHRRVTFAPLHAGSPVMLVDSTSAGRRMAWSPRHPTGATPELGCRVGHVFRIVTCGRPNRLDECGTEGLVRVRGARRKLSDVSRRLLHRLLKLPGPTLLVGCCAVGAERRRSLRWNRNHPGRMCIQGRRTPHSCRACQPCGHAHGPSLLHAQRHEIHRFQVVQVLGPAVCGHYEGGFAGSAVRDPLDWR